MKKVLVLLLAAALMLSVCACSSGTGGLGDLADKYSDAAAEKLKVDFAAAYEKMDPDAVVMTIDGDAVKWSELFYWIHYFASALEENAGPITDWSAQYTEGLSYADYCLESAYDNIMYYKAVSDNAKELNVVLDEERLKEKEDNWAAILEEYGGEEGAKKYLEEIFCTQENYDYMMDSIMYYYQSFDHLFGKEGKDLPDEDVADYVAEDGYMMAKHILIKPDGETDKAHKDARMKAESLLIKLRGYTGDDFEDYFDSLMLENSADTGGVKNFPDGYLFQTGEMVSEFEEAYLELDEYELSDIVVTSHGYHIILRIPPNYDVMPMSYSSYAAYGYTYSLRYIVASQMYESVIDGWIADLDAVKTEKWDEINLLEWFAK